MTVQFIDLSAQQKRIRASLEQRIKTVLDHGQYIMGPEIRELESLLARYVGAKHCLSCSSGTDALLLGLMAKNIGPGDAVITSTFTFVATAEVVSLLGATPIFVDIDPATFNIAPELIPPAVEKAKKLGLKPKAVIPVDLFGLPAAYDRIDQIAREHGLFVLEDAAQSFGGELNGRKLCSFGDMSATSFFPAKPLGCYGDGGAVFTNDDALYGIMESLRIHGKGTDKYDNVRIGLNARMDTFQAAVLLAKMELFAEEVEARQRVAASYTAKLKNVVETPRVPAGYKSAWAQYSVMSDRKEAIMGALKKAGIPVMIYYPKPLHLQTAFKHYGYKAGDLPVSERAAQRIFSLPMHPYLEESSITDIADVICKA